MTRNFHRWEVDPFFQAAEEVQDSADRLESVYRTWLHANSVDAGANESIALENHRRGLITALGTAKWQLEDFERAVSYSDADEQRVTTADDAPARHKQFVGALQNQIYLIETSLLNSGDSRDLKALPVVQFGQEEKDDLALFLCGSKAGPQENLKKIAYCSSSTFSNGKGDDETFCTSSESVKSKNEVSDCFSTSASNSDMALTRAEFQRSDHHCRPFELGWTDRNLKDPLDFEVYIDKSRNSPSKPAFKQLHANGGELSVGSESRQHQFSSDFGFLKNSVANQKELNSTSKCWLPFTKMLGASDPRISRSGLKRWKDGDANLTDHSLLFNLRHSSSDLEKGGGSSYAGESLKGFSSRVIGGDVIGSSMYINHGSKASNVLQHSIFSFYPSRCAYRVFVVLLALGFLGLILFCVT